LVAHGFSHEAAETALARILSAPRVPFEKLCDPEYRNKDDSVTIRGIDWKVYRSERGFDNLLWNYWRDIGEK